MPTPRVSVPLYMRRVLSPRAVQVKRYRSKGQQIPDLQERSDKAKKFLWEAERSEGAFENENQVRTSGGAQAGGQEGGLIIRLQFVVIAGACCDVHVC